MNRDGKTTGQQKPASGSEKRIRVRRTLKDRREEVRFEPEKQNRRQNKGRRSSDIDLWSD